MRHVEAQALGGRQPLLSGEGVGLVDLAQLAHTYRRFVSLSEGEAEALALRVVFTYAREAFDVAPILALCSPLKRCGRRRSKR